MNCRIVGYSAIGLFVLSLAWAGLAAADDPILDPNEPPVRLKKKKRPDADKAVDKKTEPGKEDEDKKGDEDKKKDADKNDKDKKPLPNTEAELKEERERLVKRMLKKMETVEERLAKNDPGLGTREMQRDILKDLDALIEQTKQQPPPQGSKSRSNSSKNSRNQKNSKNSKNSKDSQKSGKDKSRKDKGRQKDKSSARKRGNEGKKDGNGAGGGDKKSKMNKNKLAELYKDVWGHLPETMRQEMDAYSRAKYIREYEALLKQYYRTISEEDRSKEGE
jgi:hypothetical protein